MSLLNNSQGMEQTLNTDFSKTWMLFESGSGVEVELSLHAGTNKKGRPIDAYVLTDSEGDIALAARRAAEAVYHTVKPIRKLDAPLVVGYDLHGLHASCPVTGGSGGLAFVVALGKRLLEMDPGPVAATGEVKSGHNGGPLGPVKGIAAKLSEAGRLLPENGWILYPKENEAEISEEIKASLSDKGLKLRPVSSVSETLVMLFNLPSNCPPVQGTFKTRCRRWFVSATAALQRCQWLVYAAVVLMILGVGYRLWSQAPGQTPVPTPVIETAFPSIHIEGETLIEQRFAESLENQLKNVLSTIDGSNLAQLSVSGKLKVLDLQESWSNDADGLVSEIITEISGMTITDETDNLKSFPDIQVKVKGEGTASSLVFQVAERITDKIVAGFGNIEEIKVGFE